MVGLELRVDVVPKDLKASLSLGWVRTSLIIRISRVDAGWRMKTRSHAIGSSEVIWIFEGSWAS